MKKLVIVALLVSLSCSPRKVLVSSSSIDSVSTTHQTEYVERLRLDTVFVDLPGATIERTIRDSVSCIAKNNVRSTARINTDGTLYHDLFIEAVKKAVPVKVVDTHTKETTAEKKRDSTTIEVPVKLPLTWREDFWCTSGKVGWSMLAALAALLIYKIIRK